MMSNIPFQLEKMDRNIVDKEILRAAIIAELDAINLYEQMAGLTVSEEIKGILLDVAREEKTHVGEFQTLLLRLDAEYAREIVAGEKEVREKTDLTRRFAG